MDAIISGRAGVAVLIEGDRFHSFGLGGPHELRPRRPSEVRLLLADAPDLRLLKDVTREEAAQSLERDADCADALDLALIVLDRGGVSAGHRLEAAVVLDGLLRRQGVGEYLENILHARPMPEGADLDGVAADFRSALPRLDVLLNGLKAAQPAARAVRRAWDSLPVSAFGDERGRQEFHRLAIEHGIFRELVAAYPNPPAPDVMQRLSRELSEHMPVLGRWRAALDELEKAAAMRKMAEQSPVKLTVAEDGLLKMQFDAVAPAEKHQTPFSDDARTLRQEVAAFFGEADAEQDAAMPQTLSTSLLSLDAATGVGGLPRGHLVLFSGPRHSGKAGLALQATDAAREEGVGAVFMHVERDTGFSLPPESAGNYAPAGAPFTYNILRPGSVAVALDWATRMITSGQAGLVVINNVNASGGGGFGAFKPAGLLTQGHGAKLRALSEAATAHGACVIFVEHEDPGISEREEAFVHYGYVVMDGVGKVPEQLDEFVSLRLDFRPQVSFMGSRVSITVAKNTLAPAWRHRVSLPFNRFGGFSREEELYTLGVSYGLIVSTGTLHSYGGTPLGTTREQGINTLAARPDLQSRLRGELRELLRLRPPAGPTRVLFDAPRARLAPYHSGDLTEGRRAAGDAKSKTPPLFERDA